MVHATIRMTIPPEKTKEALEILRIMAERTRIEPGCLCCRVYKDVRNEHRIMIEENWTSREELERYLRSPEYRNVLLVVEMAKERPVISFDTIERSEGIEAVQKAVSRNP